MIQSSIIPKQKSIRKERSKHEWQGIWNGSAKTLGNEQICPSRKTYIWQITDINQDARKEKTPSLIKERVYSKDYLYSKQDLRRSSDKGGRKDYFLKFININQDLRRSSNKGRNWFDHAHIWYGHDSANQIKDSI